MLVRRLDFLNLEAHPSQSTIVGRAAAYPAAYLPVR
jgi:hypothetical protein